MKKTLAILALIFSISAFGIAPSQAGPMGYISPGSHCAESKFQSPRYEQVLPYRHYEDRRRYNACPCPGEVIATQPYVVRTVIVRKKRVPQYYTDVNGRQQCHKVLTVIYKDIYSDGSCYVRTVRG